MAYGCNLYSVSLVVHSQSLSNYLLLRDVRTDSDRKSLVLALLSVKALVLASSFHLPWVVFAL